MDGTLLTSRPLTSVEVCAGAGGQALGLEAAGFEHLALSEIDAPARLTLKRNRPHWNVLEGRDADIRTMDGRPYQGVDLLAGGLPCPPFSIAGKMLGEDDERNLFPDFLRLVSEIRPRAILIENVRGFLGKEFVGFRTTLQKELRKRGYAISFQLLNASDFGVAQLRPRVAIVGLSLGLAQRFVWPTPVAVPPPTVGQVLLPYMKERNWALADTWAAQANTIAPTLVGGSKKHGGPDLGPTRARKAWEALGVNGKSIAEDAPDAGFTGLPRLTVRMAAAVQGFPPDWHFVGKKTPAYRQVGNAFPPPVAEALGRAISDALLFAEAKAI